MRQSKYAPLATSVVLGGMLASHMAYAQTAGAQVQAPAQRQGQVARPATASGPTAQELTRSLNSRPPGGAQAQPQPQNG
ncbi:MULTISPECIES: hypothetical protein, partial [unclassified Brevundimonas]|uniref:hypothetical protein n=1 Tax=unclassified Brevundimonas TaxID=2622653 RepID=UPI0025B865E9